MPLAPLEFPSLHLCLTKPHLLLKALLECHLFYRILFRSPDWKHYFWPLFLHWIFPFRSSIYDSMFHIPISHGWVWLLTIYWTCGGEILTSAGAGWGWNCTVFVMRNAGVRIFNLILQSCGLGKVFQCLYVPRCSSVQWDSCGHLVE